MRPTLLLPLLLCAALAGCGGETDEASVPIAEAPALAPELTDGLSVEPGDDAAPGMPEADGPYQGDLALVSDRVEERAAVGDVRLCNTTPASAETCYLVELQQHQDGSLYGEGTRVSLRRTDDDLGLLGSADRTPVELSGHIDNDDVVHLELTDGGQTQYARLDSPRSVDFGDGEPELTAYEGSYWGAAAGETGTSVLDYEVEYGE